MSIERLFNSGALPSESTIEDLAVVEFEGRPLVVCTAHGDDVWTWEPLKDEWTERPLDRLREYDEEDDEEDEDEDDPSLMPDFMFLGAEAVGGRVVVATGGHHQGPALWDLMSGELLSGAMIGHPGVHALDTTVLDGRLALLAGRVSPDHFDWDPSSPEWLEERRRELPANSDDMDDAVVARVGGRLLVASVSRDEVQVSALERAESLHTLTGAGLLTVALSDTMVVAANTEGELWRWNLADGLPAGDPIKAHDSAIRALDTITVEGRALAVTGADDGTARIWDLATGLPEGPVLNGDKGSGRTVVTTWFQGRPVAVTGGRDGIVRIWNLTP
ncbi:WD40 repeat domain-containing protein [Actinomadura oligospora]|uniref:WD40 repeat domain-containing protein n=1 Tax=Actinomadura oligospora TaxID=111804 RepID=UPI00047DE201|nr:hypothetical protein [Actinomadura oligospora]